MAGGGETTHVTIELDLIDKNVKTQVAAVESAFSSLKGKMFSFNKVMGMNLQTWSKNYEYIKKNGTAGARFANGARKMTHGLKGFRMEMLGVMFFGMMLQKTLTGLITPALEVAGVFDLIRIVLQVLFLPIVMFMLPYIIALAQRIMNWSDSTKLIVGVLVILGIILGILFYLVGTFALGIGSVIQAFGWLIPAITDTFASLATLKGFLSFVAKAWGIYLFVDGIQDILKGGDRLVNGITDLFIGAGFLIGGKKGGYIALGAVAFQLLDIAQNDAATWKDRFQATISAAFAGYLVAGPTGAIIAVSAAIVWQFTFPAIDKLQQYMSAVADANNTFTENKLTNWWNVLWGKDIGGVNFMDQLNPQMDAVNAKFEETMTTQTMVVEENLNNIGGSYSNFINDTLIPSQELLTGSVAEMNGKLNATTNQMKTMGIAIPPVTNAIAQLNGEGVAMTEVLVNQENPAIVEQTNLGNTLAATLENLIRLKKRLSGGAAAMIQMVANQGFAVEQSGLQAGETMSITDNTTGQTTTLTGTGGGGYDQSNAGGAPTGFGSTLNPDENAALFNDFIWRPGQSPISINPNDTLTGSKGGGGSDAMGGTSYSPTYNITVSDKAEFVRMLEAHDREMINELKRNR